MIGSISDLVSFNLVRTIEPQLALHWQQVTDCNLSPHHICWLNSYSEPLIRPASSQPNACAIWELGLVQERKTVGLPSVRSLYRPTSSSLVQGWWESEVRVK